MSYTFEKAEEMARALRTLPAVDQSKRRLSKQALVKHLVAEIAALQKRGYTIEQVVESLQGVGFTITTPTLKSYLQRAKAKPVKNAQRKHPGGLTAPPAGSPQRQPESPIVNPPKAEAANPPKAEAATERSGKQAFLLKDKDSY
jgi:hypothetical protein